MPTTTPEPGCYVDSHWGQYATARVIHIAVGFGWEDEEASLLADRHLASMGPSSEPGLDGDQFELLIEACEDAENWLNDNIAPDDHYWGWNDGDFGLYPIEEEE